MQSDAAERVAELLLSTNVATGLLETSNINNTSALTEIK